MLLPMIAMSEELQNNKDVFKATFSDTDNNVFNVAKCVCAED